MLFRYRLGVEGARLRFRISSVLFDRLRNLTLLQLLENLIVTRVLVRNVVGGLLRVGKVALVDTVLERQRVRGSVEEVLGRLLRLVLKTKSKVYARMKPLVEARRLLRLNSGAQWSVH